jgi:recombination protein RecR
VITVVESVLDIISFETGGIYKGLYHVLHGKIDPLNRVGPEHLTLDALFERVRGCEVSEIVIATNPDMEGESTALYIRDQLTQIPNSKGEKVHVSRLGYGLPMGGNVEYADYVTLKRAYEGRKQL